MAPRLRCAIYTRKSSEEGLEQDFNSLHAQREACEAYVRSQLAEGWTALATAYDDGGYSGGSMVRPALQRLLADIAAGRVDIVVVYKVDRLTRSLTDFAKIVEAFDQRGVSFVSVTQSFNTTSSMGRLTLNVLLSFAQFEREVTSERIRDKISASKAKGIWMGGMVPLGYDLAERRLVINEAEAATVRHIFERYLELPSVRALAQELVDAGVKSKAWQARSGKSMGGVLISLGSLRHILANRLYLGEIVHKGTAYAGQHPAVISQAIFQAAADKLTNAATHQRERAVRAQSGPLTGLLFDESGRPMGPSFAYGRGGKLYRYYVTVPASPGAETNCIAISRVSAPKAERFFLELLRRLLERPGLEDGDLADLIVRIEARSSETHILVQPRDWRHAVELPAVRRRLRNGESVVEEGDTRFRVVLQQRLAFRGGRAQTSGASDDPRPSVNAGIVAALKRAHRDLAALKASPLSSLVDVQQAEAPATQYERQLSRLAFLAPTLQRRILSGRQPNGLALRSMLKTEMPLAWADQIAWCDEIARFGPVGR